MPRYQFADTVPFFEQYSNRSESLAKCIANEWTRLSHSTMADRILDFGSGDGSLLRLTLRQLRKSPKARIVIIEPDQVLRLHAIRSLGTDGYEVTSLHNLEESNTGMFSLILASHVLYYIQDPILWIRRSLETVVSGGLVTVVIRSPLCDTYSLRQIYRKYYNLKPRFEPEEALASFRAAGTTVSSCLAYADLCAPMTEPTSFTLSHSTRVSANLGSFTRWMVGAGPNEDLPYDLQERILAFLESRCLDRAVRLRLVDFVITGIVS